MKTDHQLRTVASWTNFPSHHLRRAVAALALLVVTLWAPLSWSQESAPEGEATSSRTAALGGEWGQRFVQVRLAAELGFLSVLSHRIQFSKSGTYYDYVKEGGQDNLFAVGRLSAELGFLQRHQIVFLYQPLTLETVALAQRDVTIDDQVFPEGEAIRSLYNFPFYRLSYLYDVLAAPEWELGVGLSLQIRNATIVFDSGDGALHRSNRDIGPVPLLKLRFNYFGQGWWVGTEIDGMYAPISYLNGSDEEVVGAIVDASVRAGLSLPRGIQPFINVRYLAGGAVGTSTDRPGPGDGYVRNWLHFLTVTLGVNVDVL
jgi:hypothetical protein